MDSGACVTFYYFDTTSGAVPPAAPNKVTIEVRLDNTGTLGKGYLNSQAEPTNGQNFSFCATNDGNVTGTNRSGTYRIFATLVKDNGVGGVGNYNINTDGTASVGSLVSFDRGALRARAFVETLTRGCVGCPSLTSFAYGPSGDETFFVRSKITTPNVDAGVETGRNSVVDSATKSIGESGATVDIDTVSLDQTFVIDQTFPSTSSPYVSAFTLVGNSVLTGVRWTILASSGHTSGVVIIDSDSAFRNDTFSIDPGIRLDSDGSGTFATADQTDKSYVDTCTGSLIELFNKGETVCHEWYIFNSRGDQLTRSMTFQRYDSANVQCSNYGSITPSSGKYTKTTTLGTGSTCLAAADTTGSTRYLKVTNTDQSYDSQTIFSVSSLLRFDEDGTGSPDSQVHTCYSSCPSSEISLFNRGETADFYGFLINARGTQYQQSGVTWRLEDSTGSQVNSQSLSHSSGQYNGASFAFTASDKATADTVGDPYHWEVEKDGNSGISVTAVVSLSSLYFLDSHLESDIVLTKDDFPTENANETLSFFIRSDGMGGDASDTMSGWCHVKNVRKDQEIDTGSGQVSWSFVDPTTTVRSSGTDQTAADGWIPSPHSLLASTPVGNNTWSWICSVSSSGNSGNNTQPFSVGVEGGGGVTLNLTNSMADPLKVYSSPVIANPGEQVLITISASYLNGTARTGAAAQIFVKLYDPNNNLQVNNANPTEVGFGTYTYLYNISSTSTLFGGWNILINTTNATEPIGTSNTFYLESGVNLPVTAFETLTSTSGIEFLALISIVVAAIVLWSRTTDFLVQVGMGVLCFVPTIVWLLLAANGGSPTNVSFKAALAVVSGGIGGYLIIRASLDKLTGKGVI